MRARTYRSWASDHFECELPLDAVTAVYDHAPLTGALVRALDPEATLERLRDDIAQIG